MIESDWQGIATVILAIATLVTSIGGIVIGIRNSREIKQGSAISSQNTTKIEEVQATTHGIKNQLKKRERNDNEK